MADDFDAAFHALTPLLRRHADQLSVKADTPSGLTLVTRSPSPFPQHKGQPMYFAEVRRGKAYVSFHLMALYTNVELTNTMSAKLKKRMQGKSCFNFNSTPDPELLAELERLTEAGVQCFAKRNWL